MFVCLGFGPAHLTGSSMTDKMAVLTASYQTEILRHLFHAQHIVLFYSIPLIDFFGGGGVGEGRSYGPNILHKS